PVPGAERPVLSPVDGATVVGTVVEPPPAAATAAMAAAAAGFPAWSATAPAVRAAALRRAADLLEARRARFLALLAREAGKTLADGIAEVREAADFCRYYA
ncbi:aldehyde dehydrogenase family protein, partial [Mycobacterium tuberculosis]|nr:aldehyde dehydrogenase family protein [Mycobacterium tuberculosis]